MQITRVSVYVDDETIRKLVAEKATQLVADDKKMPFYVDGVDSIDWCDDGYLVTLDVS